MLIISPNVNTVVVKNSSGSVRGRRLEQNPAPMSKNPSAMTLRAGYRLVMVVSGNSHNTTSAPFTEMINPYVAGENPPRVISRLMVEKT